MKVPVLSSIVAIFLASVLVMSCTTSPKGRRQLTLLPEDQMSQLGTQAFQDIKAQQTTEKDPRINNYVKCVTDSITRNVREGHLPEKWEVVVFQDPSPNAFALPGGKIGVHTGMLKVAKSAPQLAAVIGHEIGHVIARHGNERVSTSLVAEGGLAAISVALDTKGSNYDFIMGALGLGAQIGVLLPFSRQQESEADLIGLDLMARSGFNPTASITLWQNMQKAANGHPPEFLSTHPSHGTRIENLSQNIPAAQKVFQQVERKPTCRL